MRSAVDDNAWSTDETSSSELQREFDARQASFHASGYRQGLEAGKEAALQGGFDAGWAGGARQGWAWGQARGAAGALRAFAAAHAVDDQLLDTRLLQSLGGPALGLSAEALPAAWPRLAASLQEADERVASDPAGEAGEAAEAALSRLRDAGTALRALGLRLQSWEEDREESAERQRAGDA
jgi:hypothetical protein